MKILVTGSAGFIGFHLIERLVNEGHHVFGVDSLNDYYDVNLKYDRLYKSGINLDSTVNGNWIISVKHSNYCFKKMDLSDKDLCINLFNSNLFEYVIHLAAQPGVRYSLENPDAYIKSNIVAFLNILEGCRHAKIEKLLYASSSSVYGKNTKVPFSEEDRVDNPISLYAATKKSNELMANTYSHLFGFNTIGMRFFTVYGPWGRPDMAPMLFANAAKNSDKIKVFNNGNQYRDFTYIDDIVNNIVPLLDANLKDKSSVFNIGTGAPINLLDFISEIEKAYGKQLEKEFVGAQPGDVERTFADTTKLAECIGEFPKKNIAEGVKSFITWFKDYYGE